MRSTRRIREPLTGGTTEGTAEGKDTEERRAAEGMRGRNRSAWIFIIPASLMVLLFVLPLFALLIRGLTPVFFSNILTQEALSALWLSLVTSTLSAFVIVVAGTPLAYSLTHWSFRGHGWVEVLVDLPLVLPPSVAGLALLITFGRRGLLGPLLGALDISLPFTTASVVIAQTFVAAPFYVRAARIGFGAIDVQLEEAAYTEGANQWQVFRFVMVPLAGRALLGGLILAWTRALGEFGATILFAGNLQGTTQTMPLAIYLGFERNLDVALALSVVLVASSAILLAVLRRLERTPAAK